MPAPTFVTSSQPTPTFRTASNVHVTDYAAPGILVTVSRVWHQVNHLVLPRWYNDDYYCEGWSSPSGVGSELRVGRACEQPRQQNTPLEETLVVPSNGIAVMVIKTARRTKFYGCIRLIIDWKRLIKQSIPIEHWILHAEPTFFITRCASMSSLCLRTLLAQPHFYLLSTANNNFTI